MEVCSLGYPVEEIPYPDRCRDELTCNHKEDTMPTEITTLLPTSSKAHDYAASSVNGMSTIFVIVQVVLFVFFLFGTEYSADEFKVEE